MAKTYLRLSVTVAAGLLSASTLLAQDTKPGSTASLPNGTIGQRQTTSDVVPSINPMGRVSSRIQNRVQNRIRNRIDRFYDPQANTTSPFEVASEKARDTRTGTPK